MAEQSNSLIYRYLLLILLPVIAYTIYSTGQDYDSGLIDFNKTEIKERSLDIIPDGVDNYQLLGNKRIYKKDNLYKYINGHAEYFISGGFKSLAVAEYTRGEGKTSEIVVDIYDMGEAVNAFGVLMDETSQDAEKENVGFMGFKADKTLTFIKGPFFIKISAYLPGASLKEMALAIDEKTIELKTSIPQFDMFPEEGKIKGSEKFFKENYRGLDFLSKVFAVDYKSGGMDFQAAMITGDSNYVNNVVRQYLEFLDADEIEYTKKEIEGTIYYKVNDPFEGKWFMAPLGKALFCLYGNIDDKIIKSFINY